MAEYGFFIPSAGRTLIAGLLAGETLEISRVMVGSGKLRVRKPLPHWKTWLRRWLRPLPRPRSGMVNR